MDEKLREYLKMAISRLALTSGMMVGFAPENRMPEAIKYLEDNQKFWNEVEKFIKRKSRMNAVSPREKK